VEAAETESLQHDLMRYSTSHYCVVTWDDNLPIEQAAASSPRLEDVNKSMQFLRDHTSLSYIGGF
jgi:hypothetical protein